MTQARQSSFLRKIGPEWGVGALALLTLVLGIGLTLYLRPPDPVINTAPLGVFPGTPAIDDLTGHAFIANYLDTSIDMLDTATGAVLRTQTVGTNGGAHPGAVGVDEPDHQVFVASDDGRLSTFDTRSGMLLRVAMPGGSAQLLAVDQRRHRLFVANPDTGTLSIVDTGSGALLHTIGIGTLPQALAVDDQTGRLFISYPGSHTIGVLDAGTGASLRVSHLGMEPLGMLVDAPQGVVFVTAANAAGLSVLDARTGALLYTTRIGRPSPGGEALLLATDPTTRHLFVARRTSVSMLDARSGRLLHRAEIGSAVVALAVDTQSHTCLVVAQGALDGADRLVGRGKVVVLTTDSGTIRRTIMVGIGPRSISVDAPRRRALVINTGLNPDGSFAQVRPPGVPWTRRLPLIGGLFPRQDQAPMPPDGHGSATLLDLSQL